MFKGHRPYESVTSGLCEGHGQHDSRTLQINGWYMCGWRGESVGLVSTQSLQAALPVLRQQIEPLNILRWLREGRSGQPKRGLALDLLVSVESCK